MPLKKTLPLLACLPLTLSALDGFSSVTLSHREHKGIGYDVGYSSLGLFLAANPCDSSYFTDLRGHIFNDGSWAANGGIGGRWSVQDALVGFNAFYDYRQASKHSDFKRSFQRVGVGLEAFLSCFEFRVNGYLPICATKRFSPEVFSHFSGNYAYTSQLGLAALPSIDAELGYAFRIPCSFVTLYAGASPYYLFRQGNNFGAEAGGKGRIYATYNHLVTIEATYSYDRIYHSRFQGALSLSIPFSFFSGYQGESPGVCLPTCIPLINRRVQREEIIPLQEYYYTGPIIDPTTHSPYHFLFIQNNHLGAGSGTFADPYSSLADAEYRSAPRDILYVLYGDNTTTNMNLGITLQEDQKLIGSAASFWLDSFYIPALTPNLFPSIQFSGNTAITLATRNEVAGLNILNSTNGIEGTAPSRGLYNIHDMRINATEYGVLLNLDNNSQATVANSIIQTNTGTSTFSIDLTMANKSSLFILNNQIENSGSSGALYIRTDNSFSQVENNLFGKKFSMFVTGTQASTLMALGNALVNPSITPGYDFANWTGDPSLFLIQIPNPTSNFSENVAIFESVNIGNLTFTVGSATFVPLSQPN